MTDEERQLIEDALEDVEIERQSDLKGVIDSFGGEATLRTAFLPSPTSFGQHEAADRLHLFISMWEDFIKSHPTIVMNERAYRLATIVESVACELYQRIGTAGLDAPDNDWFSMAEDVA